jgi:CDP-diglyceride synthetase
MRILRILVGIAIGGFVGMAALYVPIQHADCGLAPSNLCGLRAAMFGLLGAVIGSVGGGVIGARFGKRPTTPAIQKPE